MATSEQGDLHPNNADGKTSENSKTLWRRFLGDTMTKSGDTFASKHKYISL